MTRHVQRPKQPPMGCVIAFLSIFVIAGLSIFFLLTVRPIVQIIFANDWVATPAIVTSSQLETHPSSEGGPTYSIDIRYRYTFDGEDFEGDRYNFAVGSSSGREGKQAVVNRYPVGTETTCYVDPDDPASAVLFRKFGAYVWAGLFGIPFLIVPLIIFQVAVRQRRRAMGSLAGRSGKPGKDLPVPEQRATVDERGFVELKRETSRGGKALVLGIAALFWNGVVAVILTQALADSPSGVKIGLILFFGIFVLVGLGLLAAAVHSTLALFNPKTLITLRQETVRPGDTVEFAWEFIGDASRISALTMTWVGIERATHRVGTNTQTKKHRFHEVACVTIDAETGEGDVGDIPFGTGVIEVPSDRHPSFKSHNNEIIWALEVVGTVRRWPDIKALFPIVVLPLEVEESPSTASEGSRAPVRDGKELQLTVHRDSAQLRPGETLRATIEWDREEAPRSLEWNLLWHTSGLGTEDVGTVLSEKLDPASATGSEEISIEVPDFPYSFSGKYIGLDWSLEVEIRGGGKKRTVTVPITISPTDEEWTWK